MLTDPFPPIVQLSSSSRMTYDLPQRALLSLFPTARRLPCWFLDSCVSQIHFGTSWIAESPLWYHPVLDPAQVPMAWLAWINRIGDEYGALRAPKVKGWCHKHFINILINILQRVVCIHSGHGDWLCGGFILNSAVTVIGSIDYGQIADGTYQLCFPLRTNW